MGFALERAPRFVGTGFGVAAHPGDRDGVQGAVQRMVSATGPNPGPRDLLGWEPCQVGAVADLTSGSYWRAGGMAQAGSGSFGP